MANIVEEIFDTILNLKMQIQQRDQTIEQLKAEVIALKALTSTERKKE